MMFRQILRLPGTLATIRTMILEDFSASSLDRNIEAFEGFYRQPENRTYRMRPWDAVPLRAIGPRHTCGIPPTEMASMMTVAMELEEPILDYSRANGEGFRQLLPRLARFMGRSDEEAARAERLGLPWCESPWCAEERRHANTFARIIERLSGRVPDRKNPNRPMAAAPDRDAAERMLLSRESAEWNSSSTYIMLAAHSRGELRSLVRNIARDEIKHLSIISAARRYLSAETPWRRFRTLVAHSLNEYRGQKQRRTGGQSLGRNPVSAFEVVAAHLMIEFRLRRWLKGLRRERLAKAFEG